MPTPLRYCFSILRDSKPVLFYDGVSFVPDPSKAQISDHPIDPGGRKWRGERIAVLIFSGGLEEALEIG